MASTTQRYGGLVSMNEEFGGLKLIAEAIDKIADALDRVAAAIDNHKVNQE
jgi:hypothetical protein